MVYLYRHIFVFSFLFMLLCSPLLAQVLESSHHGHLNSLIERYDLVATDPIILISPKLQRLYVYKDYKQVMYYAISTSKYGLGSQEGSYKTPLGVHRIQTKIGDRAPMGMVFKYRVSTGKVLTDLRENSHDIITTRVLHLMGLEDGLNKGEGVDSYMRCIYIHGTAEEDEIGQPASHGCIRMNNKDVIRLFDFISEGTLVSILHDV